MNIEDLARQAGMGFAPTIDSWLAGESELARFAALVLETAAQHIDLKGEYTAATAIRALIPKEKP